MRRHQFLNRLEAFWLQMCGMKSQVNLFGETLRSVFQRYDLLRENLWLIITVLISPMTRTALPGQVVPGSYHNSRSCTALARNLPNLRA